MWIVQHCFDRTQVRTWKMAALSAMKRTLAGYTITHASEYMTRIPVEIDYDITNKKPQELSSNVFESSRDTIDGIEHILAKLDFVIKTDAEAIVGSQLTKSICMLQRRSWNLSIVHSRTHYKRAIFALALTTNRRWSKSFNMRCAECPMHSSVPDLRGQHTSLCPALIWGW